VAAALLDPAVRDAGLVHLRLHDLRHTAVALWMAAGANPKEVAARAWHSTVSFTLDRYEHLLPGSEQRLNDALDALAEGALATAEVTHDIDVSNSEKTIAFAHVARTPEDRDESVGDTQLPEQGEQSGRCGVDLMGRLSNPPEPLESVLDQGGWAAPHPSGARRKSRNGPSGRQNGAIRKKRDGFQTLSCAGSPRTRRMNLQGSTGKAQRSIRWGGGTASTEPPSSITSISGACPVVALSGR